MNSGDKVNKNLLAVALYSQLVGCFFVDLGGDSSVESLGKKAPPTNTEKRDSARPKAELCKSYEQGEVLACQIRDNGCNQPIAADLNGKVFNDCSATQGIASFYDGTIYCYDKECQKNDCSLDYLGCTGRSLYKVCGSRENCYRE